VSGEEPADDLTLLHRLSVSMGDFLSLASGAPPRPTLAAPSQQRCRTLPNSHGLAAKAAAAAASAAAEQEAEENSFLGGAARRVSNFFGSASSPVLAAALATGDEEQEAAPTAPPSDYSAALPRWLDGFASLGETPQKPSRSTDHHHQQQQQGQGTVRRDTGVRPAKARPAISLGAFAAVIEDDDDDDDDDDNEEECSEEEEEEEEGGFMGSAMRRVSDFFGAASPVPAAVPASVGSGDRGAAGRLGTVAEESCEEDGQEQAAPAPALPQWLDAFASMGETPRKPAAGARAAHVPNMTGGSGDGHGESSRSSSSGSASPDPSNSSASIGGWSSDD
jgi:hypothetical protein